MTIIFNYIFKRLLFSTSLLTCILVAMIWLAQSLRFLDMIVNRNVSLHGYFYLIGLLLPDLLVVILPICLFISVVFFYNKFQADHELLILKSTGLSPIRIAKPALWLAALVIFFTFLINVYILPPSFKHFKDMEHTLRQHFSSAMLQEGRFNDLNGVTIYIKQRYRNGRMEGIFLYHQKQKHPYTLFAKEGELNITKGGGIILILKNGFRQERDLKTGTLNIFQFDTLQYDLTPLLQTTEKRRVRPYEKSITELLTASHNISKKTQIRYRVAAHQRILQPLFGIAYVLIALNFLLQSSFNRRGRQLMILGACICALLFHITIMLLINLYGKIPFTIPLAYGVFFLITLSLFSLLCGFYTKKGFYLPRFKLR